MHQRAGRNFRGNSRCSWQGGTRLRRRVDADVIRAEAEAPLHMCDGIKRRRLPATVRGPGVVGYSTEGHGLGRRGRRVYVCLTVTEVMDRRGADTDGFPGFEVLAGWAKSAVSTEGTASVGKGEGRSRDSAHGLGSIGIGDTVMISDSERDGGTVDPSDSGIGNDSALIFGPKPLCVPSSRRKRRAA